MNRWAQTGAALAVAAASVTVAAQASRTVPDGVFTNAHAARGETVYAQQSPAPAAAGVATGAVRAPVGNLAQLMRGVFFPNANMIFTVQTQDPAAPPPKPAPDAQANGFSWVSWGAGIYPGWQLVDNAAVALADITPIMLNPGLRCENGRPAPVTDPEWIKFTEDMIAVSRQLYRLSLTRNQEAVSDATGDLTDACARCHQAYRDVRGRGAAPPDPANPQANTSRCSPRQATR